MEVNLVNAIILIGLSILAVIFGVLPIKTDANVLKLTLLIPMFVLSLAYGLLPNMLHYFVCDIKNSKLKSVSSLISSLLTCFAGGVILGLCILDLLPVAKYDFEKVEKYSGWTTHYPFVELFIGLGLLLMFLIDELVKKAFKEEDDSFTLASNATSMIRRLSTDENFRKTHGTAAMFEALRAVSTQQKEVGLERRRNGTMTTFKVFSPKKTNIRKTHAIRKHGNTDVNGNTVSQNGHAMAYRTKTCPEKIKKKHEDATKTFSSNLETPIKKFSTPDITMKRLNMIKNFQEKSLSVDCEDKNPRNHCVKFDFDDKELPILQTLHKKKSHNSIRFSLEPENFESGTYENDIISEKDDIFPSSPSFHSPEGGLKAPPRPSKLSLKKLSTVSTESSLGTSKSPLVKILSSKEFLKKVSFKNHPHKMRTPTIESAEIDLEDGSPSNYEPTTPTTPMEIESTKSVASDRPEIPSDGKNSCLQALLVISVFFFHAFLEGFSFGIQEVSLNIMSLFFGIMVHKSMVMYSAGLNLKVKFANSKLKLLLFLSILAIITPIGAVVGYLVEIAKFNKVAKALITTILHCMSISMFLFLAIFEIIAEERVNKHSNLLQWIGYAAGFIVIAAILVAKDFTYEDH